MYLRKAGKDGAIRMECWKRKTNFARRVKRTAELWDAAKVQRRSGMD